MMAYVNFICVYITKVHDDYVLPPFSTETVKSGLEMVQVYLNQKSHVYLNSRFTVLLNLQCYNRKNEKPLRKLKVQIKYQRRKSRKLMNKNKQKNKKKKFKKKKMKKKKLKRKKKQINKRRKKKTRLKLRRM
ncbi:Hypothetical_protein [Hexamita inflata]|uniref:Hypothetical_protein n=1 Tax=Hexamita inflata TaxID=28002 RepID=A0AA86NXZ0_9EUKA|nr:Hypothetical protein HINF_LOCUS14424 [Hexamita inflata]